MIITKKPSTNTSGYLGVKWHAGKWEASIKVNGKFIYLGRFTDINEAVKARETKFLEVHGNAINSTSRECTTCHKILPFSSFNKASKGWKGYSAQCRECLAASKIGEYKFHNAYRLYKIRKPDYIALLKSQDYKCAICSMLFKTSKNKVDSRNQCVDHDHKTGVVRGLLCRRCNLGLGYFNDDMRLMDKAIEYVRSKQGITGKVK